jgi:hypothetical protein
MPVNFAKLVINIFECSNFNNSNLNESFFAALVLLKAVQNVNDLNNEWLRYRDDVQT